MVYGTSDVGGDNNKSSLVTQGTFNGHLQQASPNLVASVAATYKLDFIVWCARTEDVVVGDILILGSDQYSVMAIQDNLAAGGNKHYELHLRKGTS